MDHGTVPTTVSERYEFLDVLRGVALMGIVLANMISYSLYLYLPDEAKAALPTVATDKLFDFLELVLVESKFYTIFSVLFGIGFSILHARGEAKGIVFHRFFLRRAGLLWLIGLAHAVLFWHNDILEAYAFCGVLLLPFLRARNGTILMAAAIALIAPAILWLFEAIPPETFTGPRDVLFERFGFSRETRVEIWSEGTFGQIVLMNISSWFGQVDYVITSGMLFKIYGCFLLGLLLGRCEVHKNLQQYAQLLKRVVILGLLVGIPLNVIYARTYDDETWLHIVVSTVAILPLSAAYASIVALLWMGTTRDVLSRLFAPVGRMALTNYVGQSAVCMLLFRGVGLGLGGRVGPTLYISIGAAIYFVQLAVSRAWLSRFQFGPLEWLWRMSTYGQWISLTRRTRAA